MRHRTLLTSLLLLLSLLLSGWSSVWVAAFCPRAAGQSAQVAEPDACCRARLAQQREHCGAAASDEAMAMDEMNPSPRVREQTDAALPPAHGQAAETCTHCVNCGGLVSTLVVTRGPEQKRRAMGLIAPQASSPLVLHARVSAPVLQARQHAPPGAANRRQHLLLNIFVI